MVLAFSKRCIGILAVGSKNPAFAPAYTFGRIDCDGGAGLYLVKNECDSSQIDHQAILMKHHAMGAERIFESPIYFTFPECIFTVH